MGIGFIKEGAGYAATKLNDGNNKLNNMTAQVRKNPTKAAGKGAAAVLNATVAEPAQIIGSATLHAGKSTAAVLPWAAKGIYNAGKGTVDARKQRKADAQQVRAATVAPAGDERNSATLYVNKETINTLREGLMGAFAQAEAVSSHLPTVDANMAKYALHIASMVGVKGAKAAMLGVAAHAIPGLPLFLLHYIAPNSEELVLNAIGLKGTATRLAAAVGTLAVTHKPFSTSLHESNLWESAREMSSVYDARTGSRRDIQTLEKALKAAETLLKTQDDVRPKDADRLMSSKKDLRALQAGLKLAANLQQQLSHGALEARFPGFVPNGKDATEQADALLKRFGMGAFGDAKSFESFMQPVEGVEALAETKAAAQAKEVDAKNAAEAKTIPTGLKKMMQLGSVARQKRHADDDFRRYYGEAFVLVEKHNGTPPEDHPDFAQVMYLKDKASVADLRSQVAVNRRERIQAGRDDIAGVRHTALQDAYKELTGKLAEAERNVAAHRGLRDHPAASHSGGDWRVFRSGYEATVNHADKNVAALDKKIAAAEASIQKQSAHPSRVQKVRKTIVRLQTEREIASLKGEQGLINLALGAKNDRSLPEKGGGVLNQVGVRAKQLAKKNPEGGFSLMQNYLKNDATIKAAEARLATERDNEQRGSAYVKPNAAAIASAPGLVNGAVKVAWYSVAVVPLINLPYWGIKWAMGKAANSRLKTTLTDTKFPTEA